MIIYETRKAQSRPLIIVLKTWALSIIAPAIAVFSLWRLRFVTQEPVYCSITA